MMLLEEADRVLKVLKSFITTNYPSQSNWYYFKLLTIKQI